MKARTLVELLTLSSNLYMLSRDKELMEKLHNMADKGKDKINEFMASKKDENGEEIEFMQRLALKAHDLKEEIEAKVAEMVAGLYEKIHIAHTDEIKALQLKLEEQARQIALLEARLNRYENNG